MTSATKSNSPELGFNRTGIATSPTQAKEMEEETLRRPPDQPRMGAELGTIREHYAKDGEKIGSLTPPATFKGIAKTAFEALKGNHPTMLIDQLGARLAFERSGVRLYEALLSKLDAYGSWDGGPTRAELKLIMEDELVHFHMVRWAIQKLGADPTLITPAAEVTDVASMGLRQIIADPRTDLFQCLQAILIAELTDNDAWTMLIASIEPVDREIAGKFGEALVSEARHLTEVRTWVLAAMGLDLDDVARRVTPPILQRHTGIIEPAQP